METNSPPVLPIISPCVMYFRRSDLILPRTICLNRLASRSIFRTTVVWPSALGLGAAPYDRPEIRRRLPGCAALRHPVSAVYRAEKQKIVGEFAWNERVEVGRGRFGVCLTGCWCRDPGPP